METKDFRTHKTELDAMKAAYFGGKVSYSALEEKARLTANAFNAEATVIAKRFKRRPKFINATTLLR